MKAEKGKKNCGLPGIIEVIISVWHCFAIFFLASIGYLVILLLVGAYFAEFLADHLHTLNVTWIGMMIVGGYLVTIGVYSVVTYTLHTIRYGRAQKGAAAYERRLRELEALYEEE